MGDSCGLKFLEAKNLPINLILQDSIFQPRQYLHQDVADRYSEFLLSSEEKKLTCPPVDVLVVNREEEDYYYLIHGHHRLKAFIDSGFDEIPCNLYQGTWEQGVQFACRANIFNGLQLSRREIAIACRRYLEVNDKLPKEERESDRQIAKHFMIDPKTVRNYRKQNEAFAIAQKWEKGVYLLHKNWSKFDISLKPFCYAMYKGDFDQESNSAFFTFPSEVCFSNGSYSIYDFEPEPVKNFKPIESPPIDIGSVVWIEDYSPWGIVFGVEQTYNDFRYQVFSWDYGICKTYRVFGLTKEQAIALSSDAAAFFPKLSIVDLIPKAIDHLHQLIRKYEQDISNDNEPLVAKAKIDYFEQQILDLQSKLDEELAKLNPIEEKEEHQSSSRSQQKLINDNLDDDWDDEEYETYTLDSFDMKDSIKSILEFLEKNSDKISDKQLMKINSLVTSIIASRKQEAKSENI